MNSKKDEQYVLLGRSSEQRSSRELGDRKFVLLSKDMVHDLIDKQDEMYVYTNSTNPKTSARSSSINRRTVSYDKKSYQTPVESTALTKQNNSLTLQSDRSKMIGELTVYSIRFPYSIKNHSINDFEIDFGNEYNEKDLIDKTELKRILSSLFDHMETEKKSLELTNEATNAINDKTYKF